MTMTATLTDVEFTSLLRESPLTFSARLRAETMTRNLRERIAAVAADLRHFIVAGEILDAVPAARIANEFDHLAHMLEADIGTHDADRFGRFEAAECARRTLEAFGIDARHTETPVTGQ